MKNILWLICIPTLLAVGCASEKGKPLAERGWIGGEYVAAKPSTLWNRSSGAGVACTLPKALQTNRAVAVQITRLNTNSPAALAGLRKDDFIVEVNHRPVGSLQAFRRTVDRSQSGTTLTVTAWRDKKFVDFSVPEQHLPAIRREMRPIYEKLGIIPPLTQPVEEPAAN